VTRWGPTRVIEESSFRNLCGYFATGITIVTAFDDNGVPAGMTVNSFASVSLVPPLVSVAIDSAASAYQPITQASRWTINILESNQESLSRRFSSPTGDRFDGVDWHRGPEGELLLDGVLAHLVCDRKQLVEVGDHMVLIGEVKSGEAAENGDPLLYYRGGYFDG
jgi:flavin reductase (DIM6/NTAB) family NADH-FMN oxidoreductase RutF